MELTPSRGLQQFVGAPSLAPTSTISLSFAAATDIGCARGSNEDSFGYDAHQNIYVVCDGIGGAEGGEVASSMAVRSLIACFELLGIEASENQTGSSVEEKLSRSISLVNSIVRAAAASDRRVHSMGTTLVCACLDGNRIILGNVGDSRAYLIRNGVCRQITLDHSLVAEQVRDSPAMSVAPGLQSVITRAIGAFETVEPDFFAAELQPDDMLLLTSDGLTRYVLPEEIASVAQASVDLSAVCQALIEVAKRRGGVDNITCMMLRAVELQLKQPVQDFQSFAMQSSTKDVVDSSI